MFHSVSWTTAYQYPQEHKQFKLGIVCILLLMVSLGFTSVQSRSLSHQIDNRSPEIDPYWYVGRGVRPIGRFGKRQIMKTSNGLRHGINNVEFLLKALLQQEVHKAERAAINDDW